MLNRKSILKVKSKKAQEEMAGFAIILVLLGIILVSFLAASLRSNTKEKVESYELSNFLQSVLQQTTNCQINGEYKDFQDLIFECIDMEECDNSGVYSCEYLETFSKVLVEKSWPVGENQLYKGYDFAILFNEQDLVASVTTEGELTTLDSYSARQDFSKSGDEVFIEFTLYF